MRFEFVNINLKPFLWSYNYANEVFSHIVLLLWKVIKENGQLCYLMIIISNYMLNIRKINTRLSDKSISHKDDQLFQKFCCIYFIHFQKYCCNLKKPSSLNKKMSHFYLKSWVAGGTKFVPGFRVIGEYMSQIGSTLSPFDSNILQLLGIPGGILFPPVTQILGSIDPIFSLVQQWSA